MMGKYAEQRRSFLENHAPEMYEAMASDGSLEAHLELIQQTVSDYVDNYVEAFKHSEEYNLADSISAMRMINMTVLEAENNAYRMWIAALPDEEENEEYEEE